MSRAVESRDTPGSGNPKAHDPGRGHRVTPGAPLARRRPPSLFGAGLPTSPENPTAGLPAVDVTLPFEETFGRRIVARSGDRPERSRIDPVGGIPNPPEMDRRIRNPPYGKWNRPLRRHRNPRRNATIKAQSASAGAGRGPAHKPRHTRRRLVSAFFTTPEKTATPADGIELMPRRES
jgi:hypothetical protein